MDEWFTMWEEQRALRDATRSIVRKWLNQSLTRGWSSWVEMWEEATERSRPCGDAKFLMNRELAGAWVSWKEMAAEASEAKGKLSAAASSMLQYWAAQGIQFVARDCCRDSRGEAPAARCVHDAASSGCTQGLERLARGGGGGQRVSGGDAAGGKLHDES